VAVFNLDNAHGNSLRSVPRRYRIPLARLGMDAQQRYWGSEFWSGQHLGELRGRRSNPRGYEHPGDLQDLFTGTDDGAVDLSFAGPAVKLLCLRAVRAHPWVAATTFHQSCGAELMDVTWDEGTGALSGTLRRPAGISGAILFAAPHGGWEPREARVGSAAAHILPTANGGWKLPVIASSDHMSWFVQWQPTHTQT
jgi:hypothetical protein